MESEPTRPKVYINFEMVTHGTDKDLSEEVRQRLEYADIVIIELYGWSTGTLKTWQALSDGQVDLERDWSLLMCFGTPGSFWYEVATVLSGSHKKIAMVDIPDGEQYQAFENKREDVEARWFQETGHESFDNYLQHAEDRLRVLAEEGNAREQHVIDAIPERIREIVATTPDLAEKADVLVSVLYGGAHTRIPRELSQVYEVSNHRSEKAAVFDPFYQLVRRMQYGKDFGQVDVARVVIYSICKPFIAQKDQGELSHGTLKPAWGFIADISLKEAEELYTFWVKSGYDDGVVAHRLGLI